MREYKEILILATTIAAISLLSWILVINIPVSVEGKRFFVPYRTHIETLLEKEGFAVIYKQSVILGTTEVAKKKALARIYINSQERSLKDEVICPSTIELKKKPFSVVPASTLFEVEELPPVTIGNGPFVKLEIDGMPEVRMNTSMNQKTEISQIVFKGRPPLFRKTDGIREKIIALTFDDGPSIYTPSILNILEKYRIKATFFMIGKHIERHPEIARMVARKNHLIGNHTYGHINLRKKPYQLIRSEIDRNQKLIKSIVGYEPNWFRPPQGGYDTNLANFLKTKGMGLSLWTIDTIDWKNQDRNLIYLRATSQLKPGDVILLHDGGGPRKETAFATEMIIRYALKKGFVFATLADLEAIKAKPR